MNQLLIYFQKTFRVEKLGDITWSHAVNSREKLERVLSDSSIMVIESDIRISPNGTIVAAHPPETHSDLTLDALLHQIVHSKKGIKLDCKDPEVVITCLDRLCEIHLSQPVFLNADILQGNGAPPSKFSPEGFIGLWKKYYPQGMLSLGWTTLADPAFPYTNQNIDEMLSLIDNIETVTFPVRACLLPNSWAELKRLIESQDYSLSVWNNEPVDDQLQKWIRQNTDPTKTMYDFIDENKEPVRFW